MIQSVVILIALLILSVVWVIHRSIYGVGLELPNDSRPFKAT